MRAIVLSFALSLSLFALLALDVHTGLGPAVAPVAVGVGVVAASALHGDVTWLTVSFGALSPLALSLVARRGRIDAVVALATLLWAAPRFALAAGTPAQRSLALAAAAAVGASVVAGLVVAAYGDADVATRFGACVFAGAALALASLPSRRAPDAPADVPAPAASDGPADVPDPVAPKEPAPEKAG